MGIDLPEHDRETIMHLNQELISSLSSDDEPVTKMEINSQDKILKIFTNRATILDKINELFKDRTEMWLGKGFCIFMI